MFVSNRLGSDALWSIAMQNNRAAGEPSLLTPTVLRPLAVTRGGQLFYDTTVGTDQQAFLASTTPTGGRVSKTFTGEGLGYSPDGRSLAYIRNSARPSGRDRAQPGDRRGEGVRAARPRPAAGPMVP